MLSLCVEPKIFTKSGHPNKEGREPLNAQRACARRLQVLQAQMRQRALRTRAGAVTHAARAHASFLQRVPLAPAQRAWARARRGLRGAGRSRARALYSAIMPRARSCSHCARYRTLDRWCRGDCPKLPPSTSQKKVGMSGNLSVCVCVCVKRKIFTNIGIHTK